MKVPKKSNAENKRRRKGKGPVRPPAQQQAQKEGFGGEAGESRGKPYEPIQPPFPPGLKTQPDGQERLRKLWEHKQGELETRRKLRIKQRLDFDFITVRVVAAQHPVQKW